MSNSNIGQENSNNYRHSKTYQLLECLTLIVCEGYKYRFDYQEPTHGNKMNALEHSIIVNVFCNESF